MVVVGPRGVELMPRFSASPMPGTGGMRLIEAMHFSYASSNPQTIDR